MNGIIRSALRVAALKNAVSPTINIARAQKQICRTLWNSTNNREQKSILDSSVVRRHDNSCMCGCKRFLSTKAEKDLLEFLAEEIVAEKQAQKLKTIPAEIEGFKVSLNGADVTLIKEDKNEKITVSFNVNHTVDSETEPEINIQDDKPDVGEMKSKPNFEVDIKRGNQTLGFSCSFNTEPGSSGASDEYNDIFGIDEITLYEGEYNKNVYAVGGEIIDGYLYDLLMNYLEEKGISNEFAEKLVDLSTNYEHTAYISLLEGLSKFTTK